jgi:hypothetical protein
VFYLVQKVGLIDIDSKLPNLALMKLSAYHKKKGDIVSFWNAFENYDLIYSSKIFSHSKFSYKTNVPVIKGGSGYSLQSKLINEIEHIYPDYSLYNINYAMGFLTRGCINKCSFCVVPTKEGELRKHADLEEFWNGQQELMLLDNSLTDFKNAEFELKKIRDFGIRLNLTQGFNIRTITPTIAEILSSIKLWKGKQWHIAWDNIKDEKSILQGIEILNNAGIKNHRLMVFILIGFNSTMKEDLYRIRKMEELGLDPFVMSYVKNQYTIHLSRWCNRKPIMKKCSFEEYIKNN